MKRRFYFISTAFLLFLIGSCGVCNSLSQQYYFTEKGGVRPAKSSFKLALNPYWLNPSEPIKTNCVYVTCNTWNKEKSQEEMADCNDSLSYRTFIRFFENGRFMMNNLSDTIDVLEQCNNIEKAKIGYYKIEGSTLFLEYYSVNFSGITGDCGKYYQNKYELSDEGFYCASKRRSSNGMFYSWEEVENGHKYFYTPLTGLVGEPDW